MCKQPAARLLLLSLIFLIAACTKEYSFEKQKSEVYFISCKVDGVLKQYFYCKAGDHTDPANGDLGVYGRANIADSTGPGFFAFEITNLAQVLTEAEYTDTTAGFRCNSVYADSLTGEPYTAGTTLQTAAADAGIIIPDHLIVTITKLMEYTARGTFSGDFYPDGDITKRKIKITDGLFYVRMN